ncbi:MAG: type IV secretion system protein [Acetobacteraceae bacterium]|nr:type IV secretion system protein [Acetobacteraceae bacterium]
MESTGRWGAALLAAALAAAAPARAQWTVIDPSNLAQAVEQVRQLQAQLQTMQQQYAQMQETFRAISHLPQDALVSLGRQLDVGQFRNALPDAGALAGMLGGGGGLDAAARRFLEGGRVYAPAEGAGDFPGAEMLRNARSIAAAQGLADGLFRSASARIEALRGLEGMLAGAPDAKAVADVQARIAQEQSFIGAQQVQAQALSLWQQAQVRAEQQRREEQSRGEIDRLIEEAKRRGG